LIIELKEFFCHFILAALSRRILFGFVDFGGWERRNSQPAAVGIDRNDAAKPTKRPGRRWRMSKSPAFGEVAKGHRGRLLATF
jgi:hypothetical protein